MRAKNNTLKIITSQRKYASAALNQNSSSEIKLSDQLCFIYKTLLLWPWILFSGQLPGFLAKLMTQMTLYLALLFTANQEKCLRTVRNWRFACPTVCVIQINKRTQKSKTRRRRRRRHCLATARASDCMAHVKLLIVWLEVMVCTQWQEQYLYGREVRHSLRLASRRKQQWRNRELSQPDVN